ncbi:MAG: transposase, partial [Acidiferrobacter sp.]
MTVKKQSANTIDLKSLMAEDKDLVKSLMKEALQEVLEAEMTELLGAGPHERQDGRLGYRLDDAHSTPATPPGQGSGTSLSSERRDPIRRG